MQKALLRNLSAQLMNIFAQQSNRYSLNILEIKVMYEARNKKVLWGKAHIFKADFHFSHSFFRTKCFSLEGWDEFSDTCFEHLFSFALNFSFHKELISAKFFHKIAYNNIGRGCASIHKLVNKLRLHIIGPFFFKVLTLVLFNLHSGNRMAMNFC